VIASALWPTAVDCPEPLPDVEAGDIELATEAA
jgi:hypothetical protein